eukprot:1177084-Prorocentrum_minimum.AAC.1
MAAEGASAPPKAAKAHRKQKSGTKAAHKVFDIKHRCGFQHATYGALQKLALRRESHHAGLHLQIRRAGEEGAAHRSGEGTTTHACASRRSSARGAATLRRACAGPPRGATESLDVPIHL